MWISANLISGGDLIPYRIWGCSLSCAISDWAQIFQEGGDPRSAGDGVVDDLSATTTTNITEGNWNGELQRSGEATEEHQALRAWAPHNFLLETDIPPSGFQYWDGWGQGVWNGWYHGVVPKAPIKCEWGASHQRSELQKLPETELSTGQKEEIPSEMIPETREVEFLRHKQNPRGIQ